MHEITTVKTVSMTTVEIAKQTGKAHKHVLTDTRNMLESLGIGEPVFRLTYKDVQGKIRPCYNLPKREVLILVSGYSIKLRAAIIDKLEELEKGVIEKQVVLTPMEMLLKTVQHGVEMERRQLAIEEKQLATDKKIDELESKMCSNPGYFTVTGYANLMKVSVTTQEANKIGRKAAKLSRESNTAIGKSSHERWGEVNTYHKNILQAIFPRK